MNSRIDKLLILCLIFVISLCSNIYSNENKWKIEIELEKHEYVLHERIWLDVTLTNNTSDSLRTHGLEDPNHRQFTIEIKDSYGKLLEYTGITFLMASGSGQLLLKPEEQDYGSFNLTELFGSQEKNSGYLALHWIFPFIPKGSYIVQVLFEGDMSNELSFNIVEPFGEEKEVLDLIEKASGIWARDNTSPSIQSFQNIVDRFPNSVFTEQSFYFSKAYAFDNIDKTLHGLPDIRILYREMLERYPNSGKSKGWLLSITRDLDDEEKIELFNKYFEENPNTRCSKFADQMRKRLLNKKGE